MESLWAKPKPTSDGMFKPSPSQAEFQYSPNSCWQGSPYILFLPPTISLEVLACSNYRTKCRENISLPIWKLSNFIFPKKKKQYSRYVFESTYWSSNQNCKEIKPVNPKGNQSWIFIGRTDGEAKPPILWPPDVKNWLIGKDPDAGKDWRQEGKGTTEDEMVGWHHMTELLNWTEWSWLPHLPCFQLDNHVATFLFVSITNKGENTTR